MKTYDIHEVMRFEKNIMQKLSECIRSGEGKQVQLRFATRSRT